MDIIKNSKGKKKLKKEFLEKMFKIIKLFREQYNENKKRITKYTKAKDGDEIIPDKVEYLKTLCNKKKASEEEISKNLKEDFENNPGDKICLANSHVMTIFELTEAYKTSKNENPHVAVVVFDNHIDMDNKKKFPWKGNVFHKLLKNGFIDNVVFVGGMLHFEIPHKNNNDPDEEIILEDVIVEKKIIFQEIRNDAVKQISSNDIRSNNKLDRQKLIQKISDVINKYKEQGITNLVFSIDIDVLRLKQMGYTAMEYSPMNSLSYLASLNLPLSKKYSRLTIDEIKKILGYIFVGNQDRFNLISLFKKEICDPPGMALGDIGSALDLMVEKCKSLKITFGIDLKGGGKFLGDIVELSGADYSGKTTKAVAVLIERIKKLAIF